jgi:hypothetical protein
MPVIRFVDTDYAQPPVAPTIVDEDYQWSLPVQNTVQLTSWLPSDDAAFFNAFDEDFWNAMTPPAIDTIVSLWLVDDYAPPGTFDEDYWQNVIQTLWSVPVLTIPITEDVALAGTVDEDFWVSGVSFASVYKAYPQIDLTDFKLTIPVVTKALQAMYWP